MGSCYSSHNAAAARLLANLPSDSLPINKEVITSNSWVSPRPSSPSTTTYPSQPLQSSSLIPSKPTNLTNCPPTNSSRYNSFAPVPYRSYRGAHRIVRFEVEGQSRPDLHLPFNHRILLTEPLVSTPIANGPITRSVVRTIEQPTVAVSKVCLLQLPVTKPVAKVTTTTTSQLAQSVPTHNCSSSSRSKVQISASPKRLQQAVSGNHLQRNSPLRSINRVKKSSAAPSVVAYHHHQVSFVDDSFELTNLSSEDFKKRLPSITRGSKKIQTGSLSRLLTLANQLGPNSRSSSKSVRPGNLLAQLKAKSARLLPQAMSHLPTFSSGSSSKVHPFGSQLKPPQAYQQQQQQRQPNKHSGVQHPSRTLPSSTTSVPNSSAGSSNVPLQPSKSSGLRLPTTFSGMFTTGTSRLPLVSSKSIGNVNAATSGGTTSGEPDRLNAVNSTLSGSSPSVDARTTTVAGGKSSGSRLPSARSSFFESNSSSSSSVRSTTASPSDKFLKSCSSSNIPASATVTSKLSHPNKSKSSNPVSLSTTNTKTKTKTSAKSEVRPAATKVSSGPSDQTRTAVAPVSTVKTSQTTSSSGTFASSSGPLPELPPRHAQIPPPLPSKSQQHQNQRLNFLFGTSVAPVASSETNTQQPAQQPLYNRTQQVNLAPKQPGPRLTIHRPTIAQVPLAINLNRSNLPGAPVTSRLKSPSHVNSELKLSSCPYKRPQQQPVGFLLSSQPTVNYPNYYNNNNSASFVRNAVNRLNSGEPTENIRVNGEPTTTTTRIGTRPNATTRTVSDTKLRLDSNGNNLITNHQNHNHNGNNNNFDNLAGSRKTIVLDESNIVSDQLPKLAQRLATSCSLRSKISPTTNVNQLTYSKRPRQNQVAQTSNRSNHQHNQTSLPEAVSSSSYTSSPTLSTSGVERAAGGGSSGRQATASSLSTLQPDDNGNWHNSPLTEQSSSSDANDGALRPASLERAPHLASTANCQWQFAHSSSSGSSEHSIAQQAEDWLAGSKVLTPPTVPNFKECQLQRFQQQTYDTDEDLNTLSSCSSASAHSNRPDPPPVVGSLLSDLHATNLGLGPNLPNSLTASCCSTASTTSSFYFEQGFTAGGGSKLNDCSSGLRCGGGGGNTTASSTSQDSVSNKDLFLIDDEIADQPELQFMMTMPEHTSNMKPANSSNRPRYLELSSKNGCRDPTTTVTPSSGTTITTTSTSGSTPSAIDSPSSAHSSLTPTNHSHHYYYHRQHSNPHRVGDSMLRSIHDELYSLISSSNQPSCKEMASGVGQLANEFTSLPSECLVRSDICEYAQMPQHGTNKDHSVPSSPKAQGVRGVRGSASLRKRHSYTASNSVPLFRRPRPLSFVEHDDGSFGLDSSSFRAVSQDMMGIKTLLFRLQGVLQNAPIQNPFESSHYSHRSSMDSLPSSTDRLSLISFSDQHSTTSDELVPMLRQENFDLQQHIQLLEQQLADKERTIRLLQQQMSKYSGRHCPVPTSHHHQHNQSQQQSPTSVQLTNSTTQTEQCSNLINPRALSDGSDGGQLVRFCCSHEMDLV